VQAVLAEDEDEVLGVNDRAQLAHANAVLMRRKIEHLLASGVTIIDPATTFIEPEVEIEPDSTIQPGCHLRGRTRIARDCEIGPNSYLMDSEVGQGSRVWYSVLEQARVGQRVSIGPFSHLRPGAIIEDDVMLGNYAEVKASRIGSGTQMHHFSYVGDADVGARVNIAAGTITVNFDAESREKNRTVIGDDAAISSDTMLVAPVDVGPGAMTGAGSVVTHDIPSGEVWVGVPARPRRRRRNYPAPEPP
jgi:bifunctional UDP-N-acetylglucosamine pyrophosphorylase/glucosamine-1-phosphate N-acetyltransferase